MKVTGNVVHKAVFFGSAAGTVFILAAFWISFQGPTEDPSPSGLTDPRQQALQPLDNLPLYFVENQGQVDPRAPYYIQGRDKIIYFTADGVTFSLRDKSAAANNEPAGTARMHDASYAGEASHAQGNSVSPRWTVKLDFVDAQPGARPVAGEQTDAVISYFKGPREEWHAGLPTYSSIVYEDLWPGIDLAYSGTVHQLKHAFIVEPGADPNRIRLAYRGADVAINEGGQLVVSTPAGGFYDDTPYVYQEIDGRQVEVSSAYKLERAGPGGEQAYGFDLGKYDPARPLIVDPLTIIYSGYIGGSSGETANDIDVNDQGHAFIVGNTRSPTDTFPVTVGPDLTLNGAPDAFVARLRADGSGLIYLGYIGGAEYDDGQGIDLDAESFAYVTGRTESPEDSFPVTVGPDVTFNGVSDAWVAKVDPSGANLVYAGYIGGASSDGGNDIGVDSLGRACVAGGAESDETTFPVAVGPDLTHNGGFDAFAAWVRADGSALDSAGYIGGDMEDFSGGGTVDSMGYCYVSGSTRSTEDTFLPVVGPDLTHNGGSDAFVTKISPDGRRTIYSGYVGGSESDSGADLFVDGEMRAHLTGNTRSTQATFPVVVGPDLTHNGARDAFVGRLSADGTSFDFLGYIGGEEEDRGRDVVVDSAGCLWVTGQTQSEPPSFPVSGGPDLTYDGGSGDAYVAQVLNDGTGFGDVTYIGGAGFDVGFGIAADPFGAIYVAGHTESTEPSFPLVVGPDLTHGGASDAFVTKLQNTHKISGVLDAAGFLGLISPGSIVSVFGFFAEQTAVADSVPLSLNLNGFSVTFNDKEGALFGAFAGPFDQANVQVPWNLDVSSGSVDVRVHWKDPEKEVWSVPFSVDAALASPGIFTFDFGPGRAIVQNLDGGFAQPAGSLGATPAGPAPIGGVIIIWSNGLGPVPMPPATGDIPGFDEDGNAILRVPTKTVRVFIDGQLA